MSLILQIKMPALPSVKFAAQKIRKLVVKKEKVDLDSNYDEPTNTNDFHTHGYLRSFQTFAHRITIPIVTSSIF